MYIILTIVDNQLDTKLIKVNLLPHVVNLEKLTAVRNEGRRATT